MSESLSLCWFNRVVNTPLVSLNSCRYFPEAVARSCFVKKVFLEISQNSQENTCARVSFLIRLQVFTDTGVFLWILWNSENIFLQRTPPVASSIFILYLKIICECWLLLYGELVLISWSRRPKAFWNCEYKFYGKCAWRFSFLI